MKKLRFLGRALGGSKRTIRWDVESWGKISNRSDNSRNFLALGRELQGTQEGYYWTAVGPQYQIRLSTLTNQTNLPWGLIWVYLDVLGYTWVYLGVLGFTWVYLGVHGCTWVYLDVLGCTWIDREHRKRGSNSRPPAWWEAGALPLSYSGMCFVCALMLVHTNRIGGVIMKCKRRGRWAGGRTEVQTVQRPHNAWVVNWGEERSVPEWSNVRIHSTIRTNLQNKGLISADRRTSLLSCLQYPVLYLSRLQRIYLSQCFTCYDVWCWAGAYRYSRSIGKGEYRRFPAWILT